MSPDISCFIFPLQKSLAFNVDKLQEKFYDELDKTEERKI